MAAVLSSIGAGITLPVMNIIFGMFFFFSFVLENFPEGELTWMKVGWLVLSLDTSV